MQTLTESSWKARMCISKKNKRETFKLDNDHTGLILIKPTFKLTKAWFPMVVTIAAITEKKKVQWSLSLKCHLSYCCRWDSWRVGFKRLPLNFQSCFCFLHFHGHQVCQKTLRPLFENNIFNFIIAQTTLIIIIICILTFL